MQTCACPWINRWTKNGGKSGLGRRATWPSQAVGHGPLGLQVVWPLVHRRPNPIKTTPQVFETFVPYNFWVKWIPVKNLHTQSCKLSYCLGAYPIYKRNKVFLNVFIFWLCGLLNSICNILYVCYIVIKNTFQTIPFHWYITCGLLIHFYHFSKVQFLSRAYRKHVACFFIEHFEEIF